MPIDRFEEYLATNRVLLAENQHFDVLQYWQDRYESQPDLARFALDILAVPPMSDECERLFSSCKILLEDRRSRLQMDIIEANEVLRHSYGPPQKGTFDDEEVDEMVGEDCERLSLKEAAKARLAAAAEASTQVEDHMIDEEEEELNKQHTAIEIDYETEVIGEA